MSTQAELAATLVALKEQNDKAREERLSNVAVLQQAIIDAGNVTPEVQEALDALTVSIQLDDDLIDDAVVDPGSEV